MRRTREWKLLLNASLSFVEIESNRFWVDFDAEFSTAPPSDVYAEMVADAQLRPRFASRCFDEILASTDSAADSDIDDERMAYSEILLFRIAEDNVEACDVSAQFPDVVAELMSALLSEANLAQYALFNGDAVEMRERGCWRRSRATTAHVAEGLSPFVARNGRIHRRGRRRAVVDANL